MTSTAFCRVENPAINDHLDHLHDLLRVKVDGLAVDVGCGDGSSTRALAAAGWRALGLEVTAALVERARRSGPDMKNASFAEGRGEALPDMASGAALIVYLFSFHHVPEDRRNEAIEHARLHLATNGRLHIVDPLPDGPMSEVVLPIEDERSTRRHAHALLAGLDGRGWRLLSRTSYVHSRVVSSFQTIEDDLVRADPTADAQIRAARPEMERLFVEFGVPVPGGVRLDQPCVAYHFAPD
jgi:SAM-dependent methyltransferase